MKNFSVLIGSLVLSSLLRATTAVCRLNAQSLVESGDEAHPLEGVTFDIHHNGNATACGSAPVDAHALQRVLDMYSSTRCLESMSKFDIESVLTTLFALQLEQGVCSSVDNETATPGLFGHCDMGKDHTPVLLDHGQLVRVKNGENSLPCRWHTREGIRITSLQQLASLVREKRQTCSEQDTAEACRDEKTHVHLYGTSAGRVFMFAPSYVGEIFKLEHVDTGTGAAPYMEVLSVKPRVFDIFNFFSRDESAELVQRALREKSPSHMLKRSTTGTGDKNVFAKRTSESGFDTHGATAQKIKRRCMKVLGYDEYMESHTDGLQILRYNKTKAYVAHHDYMDNPRKELYDFDSSRVGGNRYATILLYMSDLGEKDGGETLFKEAWPHDIPMEERKDVKTAVGELRDSGDCSFLKKGSWEEEMVALCRTRLAIRPHSSRAVLFYSQHPNGKQDFSALHGGCPVLTDEPKWAANLWTWSAPREGFGGAPTKPDVAAKKLMSSQEKIQKKVVFRNSGKDPAFREAELFYDETGYWGKIGHGDKPLVSLTYEGHKWNIKVPGKGFVKQFIVSSEPRQEFII